MATDRLDNIYFISGSAVWRYSVARRTGELFVSSGLLPDGTTYPFSFNNGSTTGIAHDPNGTLWVGTDPGTGVIGQRRAWMIATQ
ncbi:MAG: two-component regulator propeller domain-containing protein [Chthoniobacterales bacterium]